MPLETYTAKTWRCLRAAGVTVAVLFGAWSSGGCTPAPSASLVDLTRAEWSVRPGFSPAFLNGLPPSKPTRKIESFPVVPNAMYDAPAAGGLTEYTLQARFTVREVSLEPYGLLLATIGENWRIYLNGNLIADGFRIEDGDLLKRTALRNAVFYVPPRFVATGTNRLTFRLAGMQPATPITPNPTLGLYLRAPYYFGAYGEVADHARDWMNAVFPPFFLLVGLYALVLFIYRMEERFPLYLGLASNFSAIYFISRFPSVNRWAIDGGMGSSWLMRVEYAAVAFAASAFILLVNRFLNPAGRLSFTERILVRYSSALGVLQLIVPFQYTDLLLLLWQLVLLPGLLVILFSVFRKGVRGEREAVRLFPGVAFLVAASLWDIVDAAYLFTGMRLGAIAYVFFMLNLALASARRIIRTREKTEEGLEFVREQEERVRGLYEAAFEALVLHEDGRIIDANPAFYRMFGVSYENVAGGLLGDFIVPDDPDCDFAQPKDLIYACHARAAGGRSFRAEIRTRDHEYMGRKIVVTAIRDVEAWRALTDELSERRQELELMVRAMRGRAERYEELQAELETLQRAQAGDGKEGPAE